MKIDLRQLLRAMIQSTAVVAVVGTGGAAATVPTTRPTSLSQPLPREGRIPALDGATTWLNSPQLTSPALRGKVVVVQFWTYSCINWMRTLPYVRVWAEKYREQGLVVIGVHSPEFGFEKDAKNVRWATKNMRIDYPVVIDSEHAVWRAFGNQYWPALYVVDARGEIRHHHFGEGGYEQSERVIQQLLAEAGSVGISQDLVSVEAHGIEAAADWANVASPENYFGSDRTEHFVSTGRAAASSSNGYAVRLGLRLNEWTLSKEWKMGRESVVLNKANGRILYRFHARDLNLVMGPIIPGAAVRFRVHIDGQPPAAAHGIDVDEQGNGIAREPRLYQLIRQPGPIVDRLCEIEFLDPGIEAFSVTFG